MTFRRDSRLTRRSLLQLAGGAGLGVLAWPGSVRAGGAPGTQVAVVVDTSGACCVY